MTRLFSLAFCASFVAPALVSAQELARPASDLPSVPGQSFETPRLLSGHGRVDLPITCEEALTRLYFEQGLVMYYHRDRREADRAFRQAASLEPDCAMPYWGLALANRHLPEAVRSFAERALQLASDRLSARERVLIDALAACWSDGAEDGPRRARDWERSLETALERSPRDHELQALLLHERLTDRDRGRRTGDTEALARMMRGVLAANPSHPIQGDGFGLRGARRGALDGLNGEDACRALPRAPRVRREAGYACLRAGRFDAAARHFELALDLEHRRMRDERLLPEEVPGHARTQSGLLEALAHLGRVPEALELARRMATTPCLAGDPSAPRSGSDCTEGQRWVLKLLEEYELWNEAVELARTPAWGDFAPELRSRQHAVLGAAAFARGDVRGGREQIEALQALWLAKVFEDESGVWAPPAGRDGTAQGAVLLAALTQARSEHGRIESALRTLRLHEALATRRRELLRTLLDGAPDLPPRTRLRMHVAAGLPVDPAGLALPPDEPAASPDRAPGGLHAERGAFSCRQRHTAPPLTLPDRNGELLSLDDRAGRPVLLVFYLGAGCLHCIEQLSTLAPLHDGFSAAGIDVIAVSTDTVAGLQDTYDRAGDEADAALPFPLVSDPRLDRFRAYRAFDEFRGDPLHGVFLLDGDRRVLWRKVGEQPFMQLDFLLEEAQRLLRTETSTR